MDFAEEKAAIDEAARTLSYRLEYIASLILMQANGPVWSALSGQQKADIVAVIDRARSARISLRRYVEGGLLYD